MNSLIQKTIGDLLTAILINEIETLQSKIDRANDACVEIIKNGDAEAWSLDPIFCCLNDKQRRGR